MTTRPFLIGRGFCGVVMCLLHAVAASKSKFNTKQTLVAIADAGKALKIDLLPSM
jgi:hypothetical protein